MAEPPQSPTIHRFTEGLPCLWVAFSAFLRLLHKDTLTQWSSQIGCVQGAEENRYRIGTLMFVIQDTGSESLLRRSVLWDSKAGLRVWNTRYLLH